MFILLYVVIYVSGSIGNVVERVVFTAGTNPRCFYLNGTYRVPKVKTLSPTLNPDNVVRIIHVYDVNDKYYFRYW